MLELFDGMLLYHGSYCEVRTPDLEKCAAFKDFGFSRGLWRNWKRGSRRFMHKQADSGTVEGSDLFPDKCRFEMFGICRKRADMEKLRDVTEEQKKFAVDATVALVVEELAHDLNLDPTTMLRDFVSSKTGDLLYDESSKLWWNGPSYIADMYKKEIAAMQNDL